MKLTSSAFQDGGKIPMQYARLEAGGKNLSPPLSWSEPPEGTVTFALSMVDTHPEANNWVHWLVINIPAVSADISEGVSRTSYMPRGTVILASELKNSWGETGYDGPQPPKGKGDHPYVITLYAIKGPLLDLPADTKLEAFKKALEGRELATATLTGHFEVPAEAPKETPKEASKEAPKETPKETPKEAPKEEPKEPPK